MIHSSALRRLVLSTTLAALTLSAGCASSGGAKKAPRDTAGADDKPRPAPASPTPTTDENAAAKTGAAKVTVGDPDVSANITRSAVDAALEGVPRAVLRCAQASPAAPVGTLTVSLQVASDGRLVAQQVSEDSIGDVALATCSADAFAGASFGPTTDSRPAYIKVVLTFARGA